MVTNKTVKSFDGPNSRRQACSSDNHSQTGEKATKNCSPSAVNRKKKKKKFPFLDKADSILGSGQTRSEALAERQDDAV